MRTSDCTSVWRIDGDGGYCNLSVDVGGVYTYIFACANY